MSSAPAASTAPAGSHTVVGRVPLSKNGLQVVVILEPRTPREFPPQTAQPVMDQISLTFIPDLLFVRTGQPAEFRNSDDTLHNVNVKEDATLEQAFNVALPNGGSYSHAFKHDGFYDVRCDIHPAMSATVVSTASPYALVADAGGRFAFEDVAPGPYTVAVFAGTRRLERRIDVTQPRTEVIIEER